MGSPNAGRVPGGGIPYRNDARTVIAEERRRATGDRRRAARAAALARSYEERSDGPESLLALRARLAVLHRQKEERHQASAVLHELYAARMEAWLAGEPRLNLPPVFMSAVAAAIGVGSAAAMVRGRHPSASVAAASDATARAAYDLEAATGEGPAVAAVAGRASVRAGSRDVLRRWPLYGPAAAELGVRAVTAIPLQVSASCVGALCVYGSEPDIPDTVAAAAGRVADALAHTMLVPASGPGAGLFSEADYQAVAHQAAGMVSVRYGCGTGDAEALLRARSFAEGRPVEEIARGVLRGEVTGFS